MTIYSIYAVPVTALYKKEKKNCEFGVAKQSFPFGTLLSKFMFFIKKIKIRPRLYRAFSFFNYRLLSKNISAFTKRKLSRGTFTQCDLRETKHSQK